MRNAVWIILALPIVCGCTQFPEIDAQVAPDARSAPYPELVALDPMLTSARNGTTDTEAARRALEARVARLQTRASQVSRDGLSEEDRTRLQQTPGSG